MCQEYILFYFFRGDNMCSIAGEVELRGKLERNEDTYRKMKETMLRRGPDENGIFYSENAVLLHTRLCIIDRESGRQPMTYTNCRKNCTLVYNGELYNTEEIRAELKADGFDFKGYSDTEVVLKAYVKWGEECVNKFNGIFAFAVWDEEKKRLFLARDRMGVKPLFYTFANGKLIFASEIKTLLSHDEVEAVADAGSIAEIMLLGPGRTPGCGVFKGISEIPPACCAFYTESGLKIKKYWRLEDGEHTDNVDQTIEKVRFLVTDAIERQLVSDVPVCTFLSGGLDSSIISSVANRKFKREGKILHTFTVDYRDNSRYFQRSKFQPNSDSEFVDIMNGWLRCENHLVTVDTPELVEALFKAVDARDLPGMADVDASLLLFCEEIKKYGSVALSGECSDEIFGGYPWYRDKTVRAIDGFPWAQSTAYRYSFLNDDIANEIDAGDYVYSRYSNTVASASKLAGLSDTESRMKEMMYLNVDWFMQTLLDRKDRMSMYSSLEVRVPFCDYRIAEYLYRVPWEMKDYKGYEKGLLREAMRDYLPFEVLWRKKSPYPKTHNPAYREAVSNLLKEVINSSTPLLQIVKKEALQKLVSDDNSQPWYGQLMTTPQTIAYFLQFDYWLRKYNVKII